MVVVITGIQFIHVFSTCSQGKKKKKYRSAVTRGTYFKAEICYLMWLGRVIKVGGDPRSSHWEKICIFSVPEPSIHFIQELEQKCSAFHWAVWVLQEKEAGGDFLLSPAPESDFLVPNELEAQPTNCSGWASLMPKGISVMLTVFNSPFIALTQRKRLGQDSCPGSVSCCVKLRHCKTL